MTNSELVLLSLIAKHPRHGYELEQVIEERGMRNWSEIAFSSIYFLLKRLVLEGMATSSTQPTQGRCPSKKVYAATPAGMADLRRESMMVLRTPIRAAVPSCSASPACPS